MRIRSGHRWPGQNRRIGLNAGIHWNSGIRLERFKLWCPAGRILRLLEVHVLHLRAIPERADGFLYFLHADSGPEVRLLKPIILTGKIKAIYFYPVFKVNLVVSSMISSICRGHGGYIDGAVIRLTFNSPSGRILRQGNLNAALLLLLLAHDEGVEHRNKEERDKGRACQSADDSHANRLHHARASARREAHGEHAEDRRKRRHQDGAQAAGPGLQARLLHLVAAVNQQVRVVNQNDTVVDDDSDQHDDSDGRKHGGGLPGYLVNGDDTDYKERNRRDVYEWRLEALVSRRHNRKDEQDGKQDNLAVYVRLLVHRLP